MQVGGDGEQGEEPSGAVTLPESVPPEPSAMLSEPEPEQTTDQPEVQGLLETPGEAFREAPSFQTLRVVVSYDVERGANADPEDVENVDINAPLVEVIAEIEEQLGSDEVFAEDIASIQVYDESRRRSGLSLTAARDEFADTSLAEMGFEDGMSLGIATFQYSQQVQRRYGTGLSGHRSAAPRGRALVAIRARAVLDFRIGIGFWTAHEPIWTSVDHGIKQVPLHVRYLGTYEASCN
jgi:hypothetical protein